MYQERPLCSSKVVVVVVVKKQFGFTQVASRPLSIASTSPWIQLAQSDLLLCVTAWFNIAHNWPCAESPMEPLHIRLKKRLLQAINTSYYNTG